MYEHISDYNSYETAVAALEALYVRPKNEVFSRYTLISYKQEPGQDCSQFLQKLHSLAKDCNFRSVTGEQYRSEYIRDAFVSGLSSNFIRQRLLEFPNLDLQQAADTALTLEMAQNQSSSFTSLSVHGTCGATTSQNSTSTIPRIETTSVAAVPQASCYTTARTAPPRTQYVIIVVKKVTFKRSVDPLHDLNLWLPSVDLFCHLLLLRLPHFAYVML